MWNFVSIAKGPLSVKGTLESGLTTGPFYLGTTGVTAVLSGRVSGCMAAGAVTRCSFIRRIGCPLLSELLAICRIPRLSPEKREGRGQALPPSIDKNVKGAGESTVVPDLDLGVQ